MSPRTGRPKVENPKASNVAMRCDRDMLDKLEYCMKALNMSKTEVLRYGVERLYEDVKKGNV